jgi:hypothetical protein
MKKIIQLFSFVIAVYLASCNKESYFQGENAVLDTSSDTLHFDTVFTSVGSVTQLFKIFNGNNGKLKLSSVKLAGGASSPFKINVDGLPGPEVNDIDIAANDSLYVFVTVKIDPSADKLPFIISDSVNITYNGNVKKVQLQAWGRNAHFIRSHIITADETWTNELPYVILGGLQIKENARLVVEKGTSIYVHADAPILVDGTLIVNGEKYDSTRVVFSGDRLDDPYRNFPGGWPGIFFRETSHDNVLQYAIIKNAYQGIVADKAMTPGIKVILNESIIDNCYDAGLIAVNSSVTATNCLFSNCGKNLIFALGGNYLLQHCTAAAYSNLFIIHKDPVLQVSNYIMQDNVLHDAPLNARFENCIFWGSDGTVEDEVVAGKQGSSSFAVSFQNCLWKIKEEPADVMTTEMIANQDPEFDSINTTDQFYNFRLKDISPAINKGKSSGVSIDLDGNMRPVGIPDLGSYEKQ